MKYRCLSSYEIGNVEITKQVVMAPMYGFRSAVTTKRNG